MGYKKDYNSIAYAMGTLKDTYTAMTDYKISIIEDFGADSEFSATTSNGINGYLAEVKTIRKTPISDDHWRAENYRMLRWCDTPSSSITPDNLEEWTATMTEEEMDNDSTPIPDNIKGKRIYYLNATAWDNTTANAKSRKLFSKGNYYLIYLGRDGLLIFNPKQLRKAFLGYAWNKVTHTEDIKGGDKKKRWELKTMLDMDKGTFISKPTPPELLIKQR